MSSMKNRGLVGLTLIGALLIAGCPAPGTPSLPGANNNGTPSPKATRSPSTDPSPGASPAGDVQEQEPNNDFDVAQVLPLDQAFTAIAGDDADFFKITLPAGTQDGALRVTLTENSSDFTPYLEIFSSSKTQVETQGTDDSTTTPTVITLNATAGKMYYFKVNEASGTAPYSLMATFTPVPDTFEPNNGFDTAKALTSGQTADLYLYAGVDTNDGSDEDYFKIEVPEGSTQLQLQLTNNSTSAQPQTPYIELFNSAKEQIDTAGASNAQADINQTFEVPAAGTYYLKFNASNGEAANKLTVTVQ